MTGEQIVSPITFIEDSLFLLDASSIVKSIRISLLKLTKNKTFLNREFRSWKPATKKCNSDKLRNPIAVDTNQAKVLTIAQIVKNDIHLWEKK